jgi:hypothetical protein
MNKPDVSNIDIHSLQILEMQLWVSGFGYSTDTELSDSDANIPFECLNPLS